MQKPVSLDDVKMILQNYSEAVAHPTLTESALLALQDEPTLYPEVTELLSFARDHGLRYLPILSTNGIGLVKNPEWREVLEAFRSCGVRVLNMSLFGGSIYHNWFTGRDGSYETVRLAEKRARDLGFQLKWNLFVTSKNADQISRLTEELADDWHTVSIPFSSESWRSHPELHPSYDDLAALPGRYMDRIRSVYKSESDWIDICTDPEELKHHLGDQEGNEGKGAMSFYHRAGAIYDHWEDSPVFRIGTDSADSLRDAFKNGRRSPGMRLWQESDVTELAAKYGNRGNGRLDYLSSYWFEWLKRSDDMAQLRDELGIAISDARR
jgi:hypothetical protein